MFEACYIGFFEGVQMLRECNVNLQDQHGWTPLMIAAQQGHADIVEYLIQTCKADISIRDKAGKRAFERATSSNVQHILSSAAIEQRLRNNFDKKAPQT